MAILPRLTRPQPPQLQTIEPPAKRFQREVAKLSLSEVRAYYRWIQTAFPPHAYEYREARKAYKAAKARRDA